MACAFPHTCGNASRQHEAEGGAYSGLQWRVCASERSTPEVEQRSIPGQHLEREAEVIQRSVKRPTFHIDLRPTG
eukprot:291713-Chlamydomonas_euryale.AAC.1